MRNKIVFCLFFLLFSSLTFASFCCQDASISPPQAKCWYEGTCCVGTWYKGCSCSTHPTGSPDCVTSSSPYLCNYNGDLEQTICCPLEFWNPFKDIDGYYCYCSSYDNCGWLFVPNITNVYPNENYIDVDDIVIFNATILPDKNPSLDSNNNISLARVCWYDNCSAVACVMSSNGDVYNCSLPASVIGLGDRYFYIWANDTHSAFNVVGAVHFVIRNITIGSLSVSGDTTEISISGESIVYDNGTAVDGTASCWLTQDPSNICNASVVGGNFSGCKIFNPKFNKDTNNVRCVVVDANGIDGENTISFNFTGTILDFQMVKPSSGVVGPGGEVSFNITLENTADVDWLNNIFVEVNVTSGPTIGEFCRIDINLTSGNIKTVTCNDLASSPGKYSFVAYLIYNRPDGTSIILDQSSPLDLQVINITVSLEFIGLEYGWVLPCAPGSGCVANYTRGQPVIFRVTAQYWPNPYYYHECSSILGLDYCDVEYLDPLTKNWVNMEGFGNEWINETNTTKLQCDTLYELQVRVFRSGIEARTSKNFTISCIPRITSTPLAVRLAVGENVSQIINVTIWNPTDYIKTFDLTVTTQPDWFGDWLMLDPHDAGNPLALSNIQVLNLSSTTVGLNLSQAGKAGAYEVTFKVVDQSDLKEYKSVSYVFIYAEGLSEFGYAGVILLVLSSIIIYCRFLKRR